MAGKHFLCFDVQCMVVPDKLLALLSTNAQMHASCTALLSFGLTHAKEPLRPLSELCIHHTL